jgi:fatty-acyl-CoA synthase
VLILQHGEDLIHAFWGATLAWSHSLHHAVPHGETFPRALPRGPLSLISVTRPAGIVTYPEFENEVRAALLEDDSVRSVIVT